MKVATFVTERRDWMLRETQLDRGPGRLSAASRFVTLPTNEDNPLIAQQQRSRTAT